MMKKYELSGNIKVDEVGRELFQIKEDNNE